MRWSMPHNSPPAEAGRQRRLAFLDYLRIFAFASVLVGHKFWQPLQAAIAAPDSPWHWPARLLWPWVRGGGAGVLVFFLVSGYIITHVLERERTLEFLIRRAFRIYPLYIVAVLAQFALLHAQGQAPAVPTLLAQLSLLGDWLGAPYTLGGVEWTLRLELVFYLLMAALKAMNLGLAAFKTSALFARWCNGGGARRPWLVEAALLPIAVADRLLAKASRPWVYVLLTLALYACLGPWPTHTAWTRGYFTLYFPCLLLGSAIWLGEHGVMRWVGVALLGLLVLLLQYFGLQAWQPVWLDAHFTLLALALFLLLWALRRRLPAPRGVLWLSELTYAVYLFHNWVFDALRDAALGRGLHAAPAQLLALAGLFALCALLTRWVERPAIGLGRWVSRRYSGSAQEKL